MAETPKRDFLLQFFNYAHLPPEKQAISKPFGELAEIIAKELPANPERTVALRKLLEAKDCAVRAGFAVMALFLFLLPFAAHAQTVDIPTTPSLLERFMGPSGFAVAFGTVASLVGGLVWLTQRRKKLVAIASYYAFHIVEDVGNEIEGEDGWDKTARYLKEVDAFMVKNGWRPLKPGEVEVSKMLASAAHGAEVAKAKVAIAAAEAAVEAAKPADPPSP